MSSVNVLDEARRHGAEAIISDMSEAFATSATKRSQDTTVVKSSKKCRTDPSFNVSLDEYIDDSNATHVNKDVEEDDEDEIDEQEFTSQLKQIPLSDAWIVGGINVHEVLKSYQEELREQNIWTTANARIRFD